MKQFHTPHRSALTAIAAVLVLGSTPAVAQQLPSGSDAGTQAPVAAAPEIVIPGGQAAPAPVLPSTNGGLAPITVAPPVAQPAPTLSQAPIVTPEPVAEAVTTSRAAEPRAAERPAPRAETAAPRTVAQPRQASQAAPAPVATAAEPMPGIAPSDLMAMEQADTTAPAPPLAQTPPAVANDSNIWAIVGGTGAVLLLGGAAYALQRRRKIELSDAAAPASEPLSARVEPARIDTVASRPVTPPAPQFARSTVSETTPATAGDLESMAAAAPTADNPFVTRRNRLRRANFLLNHGQGGQAVSSSETGKAPEMATARQSQSQQPAQPIYSFGKAPVTYRPAGLKPSTT